MKKIALIMAGGSGKRMNSSVPKQFEILHDKPILVHTFLTFFKYDPKIQFVLVLPEDQFENWKTICKNYNFKLKHDLVAGGETRFHSVKNGLEKVPENAIVFIHDGVRPLVSIQTIKNCYQTALEKGNALPVIPATESIRKKENGESTSVDRSKYFLVQTPQTFQSGIIKKAYELSKDSTFTDDASVLESAGETINLVYGNRENIKITYPQDLIVANVLFNE